LPFGRVVGMAETFDATKNHPDRVSGLSGNGGESFGVGDPPAEKWVPASAGSSGPIWAPIVMPFCIYDRS
jgi:hypothetical protein